MGWGSFQEQLPLIRSALEEVGSAKPTSKEVALQGEIEKELSIVRGDMI